jgi:hypothetical protein
MSDREHDALLARERGEPIDPSADLRPYDRITASLADRRAKPRADFDDRLWTTIDAGPARARRSRWLAAAGVVAVAAAVVVAVRVWPGPSPKTATPGAVALTVSVRAGDGPPRRSTSASVGDVLVVEAVTGGAAHVALRVYRDDRTLVLTCTDAAPCERTGNRVHAAWTITAPGVYQIAWIAGATAPPAATGNADPDLAAAIEAGSQVRIERLEAR